MAISELPLRVTRGACPHDCPDTCAWTVTVRDGTRGRAPGRSGSSVHARRPVRQGEPLPRGPHLPPRSRAAPAPPDGAEGRGCSSRSRGTTRSRTSPVVWGDRRGARCPSVMPYSYLGTQGLVQGSAMSDAFFARLGATHLVRSVCGSAGGTGIAMTIGDGPGLPAEDLAHSRYIILWGTQHHLDEPAPVAVHPGGEGARRHDRRDRSERRRGPPPPPTCTSGRCPARTRRSRSA